MGGGGGETISEFERVALTRDLPEEGLVADVAGSVVFARKDTAERPPAYALELSSVAEAMLEEATVETGAARMSGDAEIRAPVVSPDGDESPSP
jgi:hypothetical protein